MTKYHKISTAGKPDEVLWLKDGKEIKPSDDFRYENAGDVYKLIIVEIFPEDGGVYTCQASNAGGRVSSSCTVYVGGRFSHGIMI